MSKKLKLILGDQLNYRHSWYEKTEADTIFVIMEMRQETDYVQHHIQKIVGFFAAMFNFAAFLRNNGHQVVHLKINDVENRQNLTENLLFFFEKHAITHFEYQLPDEFRLDVQLSDFCKTLKITSKSVDSEHFLTKRDDLATFFAGKKTYLMESFYRSMRKKHDLMMTNGEPDGGQWNFDASNRKPFKGDAANISRLEFRHDYREILAEIEKSGAKYFGNIDAANFNWPTTRHESLQILDFFLQNLFHNFGNYEDAMHTGHWSLFHSRLSFSMNTKMLSPLEVVERAILFWKNDVERVSVEQCEGFVRQIIGWREFMRGVYWAKMPEFATLNFFKHDRKLPDWFWTGDTKMNCLKHAIRQSLDHAYAHHIQRLMITGNFLLLAGIDPDQIDHWYLGIYIDALEWVEITNTRGMSQYADGGIVGTKPYVSSANYIDKMSNYCTKCYYGKAIRTGERACPFNSLYWHFFEKNRNLLEKNPRIGMVYPSLNKMDAATKADLMATATGYLDKIEEL
jgi:deoxyribodipyrimidine photolyase-related protein